MNLKKKKEPSAELFHMMKERINHIYNFVKLYNDYTNTPHTYGTEDKINMLGIHILTDIEENPKITVTELASKWYRTKGGISQIIKMLEENGYIFKEKGETNKKIFHLYPTPKGAELSLAHKMYDLKNLNHTIEYLLEHCSEEEIYAFHKVIDCYIKILSNNQTQGK